MKNLKQKIIQAGKIHLDTMIFIYLLEGNKKYIDLVKPIFKLSEKKQVKIVTSIISYIETLSSPKLSDDQKTFYSQFFTQAVNIFIKNVNYEIADQTTILRRKYNLKTPDAIQIATALTAKANLFISNDTVFNKIEEIPTINLKKYA